MKKSNLVNAFMALPKLSSTICNFVDDDGILIFFNVDFFEGDKGEDVMELLIKSYALTEEIADVSFADIDLTIFTQILLFLMLS